MEYMFCINKEKIKAQLVRAIEETDSSAISQQCSALLYGGNLEDEIKKYKRRECEITEIRQTLIGYENTYLECYHTITIYDDVCKNCETIIQNLGPLSECINKMENSDVPLSGNLKEYIDQLKSYINSLTITKNYCEAIAAREDDIRNTPQKAMDKFNNTKTNILSSYPYTRSNLKIPNERHDWDISQQYHRITEEQFVAKVLQNDLYDEKYGCLSLKDRNLFKDNKEAAISVIIILQHFDEISDIKTRKVQEERMIDSRYFILLTKWIKNKWDIECPESAFIGFCNSHYKGSYKIPRSKSLSAAKERDNDSDIKEDKVYKEFDRLEKLYNTYGTDSDINNTTSLLAYTSECIRSFIIH